MKAEIKKRLDNLLWDLETLRYTKIEFPNKKDFELHKRFLITESNRLKTQLKK